MFSRVPDIFERCLACHTYSRDKNEVLKSRRIARNLKCIYVVLLFKCGSFVEVDVLQVGKANGYLDTCHFSCRMQPVVGQKQDTRIKISK